MMQEPFEAIEYACRDNTTLSLLYIGYGKSRLKKYCRSCLPLREGLCIFNASQKLKALKINPVASALQWCTNCREWHDGEYLTCDKCLEKARRNTQQKKEREAW